MRLRTFTGATLQEAIRQVRAELGPDAVILETRRIGRRSHEVRAGLDAPETAAPAADAANDTLDRIATALAFHGVPARLADRLAAAAGELASADPVLALAGALDSLFAFEPVATAGARPLALVGAPGAGKTSSLARLATRARLAGQAVGAITCDLVRAGAEAQLAVYTRRLEIPAFRAADGDGLARALTALPNDAFRLIDTTGANPREPRDLQQLARILGQCDAEPILVLPAGGDTLEMADQATGFAGLGCRRIVATKLDLVLRLGGLLAAADAGRLAFAEFGCSPEIGAGLMPVNPVSLARLLLGKSPATAATPAPAATREPVR